MITLLKVIKITITVYEKYQIKDNIKTITQSSQSSTSKALNAHSALIKITCEHSSIPNVRKFVYGVTQWRVGMKRCI